MVSRIQAALGITLLLSLMTFAIALAKGGFAFISVTGPNLTEAMRLTDSALTTNFFAFANFFEDRAKAPANPGAGYEITRYYMDGKREILFDRLHYYPEAGFVFYNGIENGESEYDGEWYTANPEIKTVFESALAVQTGSAAPLEEKQSIPSASQPPADNANASTQPPAAGLPSAPVILVTVTGLAVLLAFVFWRRKPSAR